jgi:hypothetical protein
MSPARIERVHRIRTRIVASATALFIALFGVIGVRLALGDDPALSTTSSTSSATPSSSNPASSENDDDSGLTTSDESSRAVSPVTTSQS